MNYFFQIFFGNVLNLEFEFFLLTNMQIVVGTETYFVK